LNSIEISTFNFQIGHVCILNELISILCVIYREQFSISLGSRRLFY